MVARNADSVLPEPVGAAISTCRPAWIAGHASACAAVGAAKVRSNQAAIAGWNRRAELIGKKDLRGLAFDPRQRQRHGNIVTAVREINSPPSRAAVRHPRNRTSEAQLCRQ